MNGAAAADGVPAGGICHAEKLGFETDSGHGALR
jgi:hypothetical protein